MRVLVARLDNAGDVLLAGPAVRSVAAARREVVFLAGPQGEAAARLLPGVSEVSVLPAPWIDLMPARVDRRWVDVAVHQLASLRCEQAIILTSSHQSTLPLALLLRMAGVEMIGGISIDYPGSLLDVRIPGDSDVHEVERALYVARACAYALPSGDDARLAVLRPRVSDEFPDSPGYVLLHPGGSARARCWSPVLWAQLGQLLTSRGHRVLISGASKERRLAATIAAASPSLVDRSGDTDFAGLTELIARASCIVVGNTGPAHLAAAVGTPVVSLFAPTVPAARWRPWMVEHVLLGDQDIACAGCRAIDCPVPGHPCIDDVPPQTVAEAVELLLQRGSGATGTAAAPAAEVAIA